LSIRDEGIGFLPDDFNKIFDRFTTAGKKGTHGEGSIGLGLYLSKKIIEKHDDKLIARSDGINKGATFTIILYQLIKNKRLCHTLSPQRGGAPIPDSLLRPVRVIGVAQN